MYSNCRRRRHRTKAKLQEGFKEIINGSAFRNHLKNKGKARKADKRVKTIAGRLVRELGAQITTEPLSEQLVLFKKVLAQKKSDAGKIYSLNERHVSVISKGKNIKNTSLIQRFLSSLQKLPE